MTVNDEDPSRDLEVLGLSRDMSWGQALAETLDQILDLILAHGCPYQARPKVNAAQRLLSAWHLLEDDEHVTVRHPATAVARLYDQQHDPEPVVQSRPYLIRGARRP